MLKNQRTIKKSVSISGIGLHTSNQSTLTFKPAPENTGIRFKRTDINDCPEILADIEHVMDISRGTTIGQNGTVIHTVEHVLAAVAGLEIDNILVELTTNEPRTLPRTISLLKIQLSTIMRNEEWISSLYHPINSGLLLW